MTTHGLSHIVLNARTEDELGETVEFYKALGFQIVLEQQDDVWLSLDPPGDAASSSSSSSIIIKVALSATGGSEERRPLHSDWSLEDWLLVLKAEDAEATRTKLRKVESEFQEITTSAGTQLYIADPLNNVIELNDHAKIPCQKSLPEKTHAGHRRKIAVLTSGGDAPAMNACVRAVVRYGLTKHCDVYAVYEGYQGLVDGGELIRKMDWKSVRGWLSVGGTTIGTARCMPFKTREGRLSAAENLVKTGINSLIVCGGDGSLTGADVFRSEWGGLVDELKTAGRITEEEATTYAHLNIVGLVGSIDNDMSSTDITIGAVTSLHRICEAVDSVNTTALSHSRAFVIEVMGRHCGWLALMAGIATGADFVFIPERPPEEDAWEEAMCAVAKRHRELGKRKTIIIVAEGAIDKHLNPIKAEYVKDMLTERLDLDTRVTILGHTQRGGSPAASDRILATLQGIEAVDAILASTPETPSPMISQIDNRMTRGPLMKAVALTHEVAQAIKEKNFKRAMELRDPQFAEDYQSYNATTILDDDSLTLPEHERLRIAILHVGAPAGGMNAATRSAVRYACNRGHHTLAVANGFHGLENGSVQDLTWMDVDGWTSRGGSELGTNRAVPGEDVDMGSIAYQVQKNNIQALVLIGGFEAFSSLVRLQEARKSYPSLCIPVCLLPATISNNVPGTDFSLGSDTSLNAIVESCDAIVLSAQSSRRRVFVVEVQGGRTGYLAIEAGLAVGANTIYIPEEGINLSKLQADVAQLKTLYKDDDPEKSEGRIILRTEGVSKTYTTEVISNILKDEGNEMFDSRTAVLGHIQQGGTPSPLDRIRATRLAMCGIDFAEKHTKQALQTAHDQRKPTPLELTKDDASVAVLGIAGHTLSERPILSLLPQTDLKNRKPRTAWWYEHRPLVDLLSGRHLFNS